MSKLYAKQRFLEILQERKSLIMQNEQQFVERLGIQYEDMDEMGFNQATLF